MAKGPKGNLRNGLRSKLAVPPRIKAKKDVKEEKSTPVRQADVKYSILTIMQYLSAEMPRSDGDIQVKGSSGASHWSISGRGRTFLVRRFPTGTEMYEVDMLRPSHALKCLRSSHLGNAEEDSLRYRSLIQELRILRHPPLAKHPNLLRIFEVGWELDLIDGTRALPTISTEFAIWGTLQNFLLCIEKDDVDWPLKRRLLLDVAEGLSALHACSIVHGDLKMENVLVMTTPEDPDSSVIAKLSDFGFSLNISEQKGHQSLIGFTPLWAAPECMEALSPEGLQLTDVYSLGFIVWSVAICGCNPFEELQEQFGEANSTDDRVGMFNFLKESNEILGVAIDHVSNHAGDLVGDVCNCCAYLTYTLQLDPAQRDLALLLEDLREESFRRKDEYITLDIQFAPLVPFDMNKIKLNKWYFQSNLIPQAAVEEVLKELELLAAGKIYNPTEQPFGSDPSVIWRFPLDHCVRQAAAAFALCHATLYHPDGLKSIDSALKWLNEGARNGLTVARVLCARLSSMPTIQISLQEEVEWLQGASKIGSRIALAQLRERDEAAYYECFEYFHVDFWASSLYGIYDAWRIAFRISEDISDHLASLIGIHPDLMTAGNYGNSLLHCAAMVGSVQGVNLLISRYGLSPNSTNDRSETPLFLACRSGHIAVVEHLLSIGADAGISNTYSENGLHWLDSFADDYVQDLVGKLCRHGANIDEVAEADDTFFPANTRTYYSQWYPGTPLQRAVVSGNLVAICALLESGASLSVQYRGINAIDRAVQLRQADILDLLLAFDPKFNLNEERIVSSGRSLSPIHRAIESVDKLQLLYVHGENYAQAFNHTMFIIFAHGIDLRSMTINPLHYAARNRNSEALQIMLEYQQLDVDERITKGDMWSATPLMEAIYKEDDASVKVLLRYGADPKAQLRWMTVAHVSTLRLCISYWHKNTSIAERLIEFGADVNHIKDPRSSDPPLFYALFSNRFQMADLLLRHGARLSVCAPKALHGNVMGELLYAQPSRLTYNAICFLVEHPLKPDIPFFTFPVEKKTVFHSICSMIEIRRKCLAPADFLATFALLRQIFPDQYLINIPDSKEFTPLHYATWVAFPEAVRALLEAGADPFYHAGPQTSGEEDTPPIPRGISALEMVQKDYFCPLMGFAEVNIEERAEWEERRSAVKALLELYI